MRSVRVSQGASLFVVVTMLCSAACETPLDALPADTVAILDLTGADGPALDQSGPLFSHLVLETSGCIALPETASFTLNGVTPEWQEPGGRGRDPFAAFNPDCMWPQATWTLPQAAATAPFVFRLENEGTSLEAEVDDDGAITRCDFPSCTRPTAPGLP